MTTYQIVIEINDVACDLLEGGYYPASYRLFKKALEILKLADSSKGESASATFVKDNVIEHLHKIKGQCVLLRPKLSPNHGLTMYDRSFKIPKNQHTTASEPLSLENIVRVIYNMALSIHLWAVEDGLAISSQKIQQALKQYGNTRKILASMLQHQEDKLLPILMATLNNEAQLYYENCQYARSNNCLESLETIMRGSPAVAKSKFSLINKSIFMYNVCWHKRGPAGAPAA